MNSNLPAYEAGALPLVLRTLMAPTARLELALAGRQPAIVPMEHVGANWSQAGELNSARLAYETCLGTRPPATKLG